MPIQRYTATPFSVINVLSDLLQAFLVIRFIFVLFHANAANWLVKMVYGVTLPFVSPFASIFTPTRVDGLTVEWASLLSMIAVAIITVFLMSALRLIVSIAEEAEEEEYAQVRHHRHRHRHA
ncbi:YggT family protein [Candidatus Peregrinibacteria bacterium]|nr:YggT family protein [Candidatus Peregrinibacteria bacterium]